MKTLQITQARQHLYSVVDEAIAHSEPIQIATKRGSVVLVSKEDWDSMQETLYLASVPGFIESIKAAEEGEWLSEDEVEWDV
jgi:prevent-host-death family protein